MNTKLAQKNATMTNDSIQLITYAMHMTTETIHVITDTICMTTDTWHVTMETISVVTDAIYMTTGTFHMTTVLCCPMSTDTNHVTIDTIIDPWLFSCIQLRLIWPWSRLCFCPPPLFHCNCKHTYFHYRSSLTKFCHQIILRSISLKQSTKSGIYPGFLLASVTFDKNRVGIQP